jgi:hypothetical protein
MGTITPTVLQSGLWDGTTWTPGTTSNLNTGPPASEKWTQFDWSQANGSYLTAATLNFTFASGSIGFTYIFDFLMYRAPITADFSTAAPPTTAPITVLTAALTLPIVATSHAETLLLNDTVGQATNIMDNFRLSRAPDSSNVVRLALGYRLNEDSLSPLAGSSATLSLEGDLQFTGIEGPYQAYGRADECPKCGGKSTRDTWTRDGYTDMMVCAECYDEEDLVGRHYQGLGSERPGQGEG